MAKLTITPLPNIPLIQPGDDLAEVILQGCRDAEMLLENGDVFVLAQKIVSKAEGRLVNLAQVQVSQAALELARTADKDPRLCQLILNESREILRTRPGTIIVEHKLGFVCANAGIDHSNVSLIPPRPVGAPFGGDKGQGMRATPRPVEWGEAGEGNEWYLLLPENPDASADAIRTTLQAATGKQIGVLIIDSHGRAWRIGTVGVAIGVSGLPAVVDQRGWQDLFGYTLKVTLVAAADELAAAASLVMGQAAEGTPIVHVRGFPYPLRESALPELIRPKAQDMFR
ncbi:MAG: coenzyme F420-0:L-glutamate ligase [Anaerolineales bacterium]